MEAIEIKTPRLRLQQLFRNDDGSDDLRWFHHIWNNPQATQWSSCGPKATLKDSQQWLLGALPRSATSKVGNAIFIVLAPGDEASTGWEPAGLVSLLSMDTSPMPPSCQSKQKFVPELGYLFHPDYWGKGYATESIAAILDAYREEKLAAQPNEALDIRVTVHTMNQASLRVVEKLGFVELGRHPGRPLPMKPDLQDLTVVHSQWRPKEK